MADLRGIRCSACGGQVVRSEIVPMPVLYCANVDCVRHDPYMAPRKAQLIRQAAEKATFQGRG